MLKNSWPAGPVLGCTNSRETETRDGTIKGNRIKRHRCCLEVKQSKQSRLMAIEILSNNIVDIMAIEISSNSSTGNKAV
jgi:hypothetical protein